MRTRKIRVKVVSLTIKHDEHIAAFVSYRWEQFKQGNLLWQTK